MNGQTKGAGQAPIVLAAGGTGGHIFPAEALAEELTAMGERAVLLTDRRFAAVATGALAAVETHTIDIGPMSGNPLRKALGMMSIARGHWQARRLLKKLAPKAVVGFGGYPSFPTVLAAAGLRIPSVIHEQNALLGRANRMLAGRVDAIATSYATTRMLEEKDRAKAVCTGNPVRAAIRVLRDVPYSELSSDGVMHLLVTGGSQGAAIFSQIVPAALATLPPTLRARIRLDQQCRAAELETTRAAYGALGLSVDLSPFFTDIPARLAHAHLVIARSGASTVAELAAAGRPALLVPYPHAMDNHQYYNATAFEEAGGGWVMAQDGFTAASLAARLEAFLGLPATLSKAAVAARAMGRVTAARDLAQLVLNAAAGEKPGGASHSPTIKERAA